MKCIVTGGCGFLGSNLVDELVKQGHDVIVIDNLSAETHEHFYFNDRATYFHYDICDYESIEPLFNGADYVFHLAAEARIQPTIENPQKACMSNFIGTANVLQASRIHKVKRLMFSSTSASYGTKNQIPYNEDMKTECLNPYSVAKVASENLCKVYSGLFGLETIIFRYFNVYGNREPIKGQYAPVIGLFIRQRNEGKPMTIVGTGEQTRDFTNVKDVVRANILAMTADGASGEIFNIGSGKNYSIVDVAKMIGKEFVFIPARLGEINDTCADISKAERILKWKPQVNLLDYINENSSSNSSI